MLCVQERAIHGFHEHPFTPYKHGVAGSGVLLLAHVRQLHLEGAWLQKC